MRFLRHSFFFASLAILASSCGSTPGTDGGTGDLKNVEIGFKFAVNGKPFSCIETYYGVGNNPDAGAQVYRGSYARYYVYDVRLVNSANEEVPVMLADDGVWQLPAEKVAEISGENGGSCASIIGNLKVTGTVPKGTYSGLKLIVGLPNHLNHLFADTQPSPLNQSDMFWSWTTGYRFLRIEGKNASAKMGLPGGLLHLGSGVCNANDSADPTKGSTCTYANTLDLSFDGFDPDVNKVVLDIGKLFQDTDLDTNRGGPAGCMSGLTDPECPAIFKKLGLPYGDGFQPDGGFTVVTPTVGQTIFTME